MTQNGASFGTYLKEKRNERGITLRGLALELNLSAPYLSDMENDRRNPPEMEKLQRICDILGLSQKERTRLFDLAGKQRNTVAPDLPSYIMERKYVAAALRTARDLDADEAEWRKFIEDLKKKRG